MDQSEEIEALKAALLQYAKWGRDTVRGVSILAPKSLITQHLEMEEEGLREVADALCGVEEV